MGYGRSIADTICRYHPHTMTAPWTHCRIDTPLGGMRLARTPSGLCGAWFDGQRHHPPADRFDPSREQTNDPLLRQAAGQIRSFFAGRSSGFDLPLDLSGGTAFQQQVWRALLDIPAGEHRSYGDIARGLGKPRAVRAVGAAVGRNPVSIVVPCHRVLGSAGQLTGYAGGLARKQALLQLEGHPLF